MYRLESYASVTLSLSVLESVSYHRNWFNVPQVLKEMILSDMLSQGRSGGLLSYEQVPFSTLS